MEQQRLATIEQDVVGYCGMKLIFKALGDTTAYMAELWGIYEGLRLARRREVTILELRTNSQIIAQSLQDNKRGSNMGCTLMKKIRRLLEELWEVQITHVFRESKRCADMLANMGSERAIGIEFFANPPPTPRVMQIVDDRRVDRGIKAMKHEVQIMEYAIELMSSYITLCIRFS
ncbi:hypothetical protein TSUD_299780 [Trifolium subterraneum]|uniref:RNase H type-1 domain-containing protein n=1 Tax=Trifolium subterraneum TaxID=3900 RepID=A0A2Z6P037_TRISU|nr:hypothetical protein TSUD_299780 [Trifolium subterraneum]